MLVFQQKNSTRYLTTFFSSLVVLLLLFPSVLSAQFSKLRFKPILSDQLEDLGGISDVIQTRDGFIWFGGQSGLARFDGYNLRLYEANPDDPSALHSAYIRDLLESKDGDLWVATPSGLHRFNEATQAFTRYLHIPNDNSSLSNSRITVLCQTRDGQIWIGTDGAGINHYAPELDAFVRMTEYESIGREIKTIFQDRSGSIWIATEKGLFRQLVGEKDFSPISLELLPGSQNDISYSDISVLFEDAKGVIWVGTMGGLGRVNMQKASYFIGPTRSGEFVGRGGIWDITEDRDGILWVGTDRDGLVSVDKTRRHASVFKHVPSDSGSLSGDVVKAILEDRAGDLWVSIFPMGVDYLDRSAKYLNIVQHSPDQDSLSHKSVLALYEDEYENLWIGTENGLDYYERKTKQFKHYRYDPALASGLRVKTVKSITPWGGYLWLGTWGGGVTRFDPKAKAFTHYISKPEDKQSIPSPNVWCGFVDSRQQLWFCTLGGLSRYDPKNDAFINYYHSKSDPKSISHSFTRALFEDNEKTFWVGTQAGLDILDRDTGVFTHIEHPLVQHSVLSIKQHSDGDIWVGTRAGVSIYNKMSGAYKVFRKKEGLPNEIVRTLLEDTHGNMWLGTDSMLLRMKDKTYEIDSFDKDTWLTGRFNTDAAIVTRRGELAFGSTNGLIIFDVDDVKPSRVRSPIALTDFQIINKRVPVDKVQGILAQDIELAEQVVLQHNHSVFSIRYALLSYRNADKNIYAYKLEGFDKSWNEVADVRRATYTNLDPGEYLFRVKAANDEGMWQEREKTLTVRIMPPPWKTAPAYFIYALVVACILVVIFLMHRQRRLLRIKMENERWRQANFDFLTDLPNRFYFHHRLKDEIQGVNEQGNRIAILGLDLDLFKEVNDTLGHDYGDMLLKQVAKRLLNSVSKQDLVARFGGDEFLIILSRGRSNRDVEHVANSILDAISQPYQLRFERVFLSTSIGISYCPDDGDDVKTLLKNTDQAMYAAKADGRNCFRLFSPDMRRDAIDRMAMVNELRVAIDEQQFFLVYQPIVELHTGKIVKAEALIRWRHPEKGLVSPDAFIPIAEDVGLIVDIGEWVFYEATRQLQRWQKSIASDFQLSINTSPMQYRDSGAKLDQWLEHMDSLGIEGRSVVVEITERLTMNTDIKVLNKLSSLRDSGILLSLDDFGTGYSSLSYLQKFEIDILKIDRSFVRNLTLKSNDFALCQAILAMANKLGLQTVAEGIENAPQRNLLLAAGCQYGQGYFYSKPLEPQAFESLCVEGNKNKD